MKRGLILSTALWAATVAAFLVFFVRGTTSPSSDNRSAVMVSPAEKDLILAEMRVLLAAVHGTVGGLARNDRGLIASSTGAAGMRQAADVNPALMAKLPLAFKQSGMSVHRDMDELSAAALAGASNDQILTRLDSILGRCVACHAGYRLEADISGRR